MKKAVYTVIMGDYDNLREPEVVTPDWDYICFTNNKNIKSKNWQIRQVNEDLDNNRLSRKLFMLFHRYLPEYDLSVMHGGQITPTHNMNVIVKDLLTEDPTIDMALARHPSRKCIYHEANKISGMGKDSRKVIEKHMARYRKEGFPENFGLIATGVMIRKHGRKNLEKHCEYCWEEIQKGSFRDQLSFNYVLWKYNLINIKYFKYTMLKGEKGYFKKFSHKYKK